MQIHYAAARNDFRAVQRQLAKGVSVNAQINGGYSFDGNTPLAFATRSPHASVEMVDMLVKAGADVNPPPSNVYARPLGLAAKVGDIDKVKYLLDAGADAKYIDENHYTSLFLAIHTYANDKPDERLQIVRLLLEAGANPNIVTTHNESVMRTVVRFSQFAIMKFLLDAGAKPDILGWTPLMRAVAVGDLEDVKREIGSGGDLEAKSTMGLTAWSFAVALGDVQKAELVMNNSALENGDLSQAVTKDNPEMLRWLMSLGLNPNETKDFMGASVLSNAAESGSTECVRVLLEANVDIEVGDDFQHRAISHAANPEIVKLLANAGADINHEDGEGYTLLKSAAEDGNNEIVRTLLDLGADPDASRLNDTPLRVAVREDHLDIVKMLLEAGADPNMHTLADGWCPLGEVKTVETLRILLDGGADPRLKNYSEYDPTRFLTDPELIEMIEAAKQPRKGKSKSYKHRKR